MSPYSANQHPFPEQGFTLIEILVAVLILSLGILGLVGMESLALKSNLSAYHRSQATILAYDLIDKMRANPSGASGDEYHKALPSGVDSGSSCINYTGSGGVPSGCNPPSIAKQDVFNWQQRIGEVLPGGSGDLTPLASGAIQTVTISWDDDRDGVVDDSDGSAESFKFSFGL
tara:strand:+ start:792 stop:1310 length:519 start_codon:yes stop_codon:yes gene_type:complete